MEKERMDVLLRMEDGRKLEKDTLPNFDTCEIPKGGGFRNQMNENFLTTPLKRKITPLCLVGESPAKRSKDEIVEK